MEKARSPIGKKKRFDVFKRDGFKCQYCGAMPPDTTLEVDHIVPVSGGGDDSADNLITACFGCNRGKGDRSLAAIPQTLEDKAAEIAEREAQVTALAALIKEAHDLAEDRMWEIAEILHPDASKGYSRANCQSIRRFIDGLGFPVVYEAALLSASRHPPMSSRCFRYFCGVCWNRIREVRGE